MTLDTNRRDVIIYLCKLAAFLGLTSLHPAGWAAAGAKTEHGEVSMKLPPPKMKGTISLEQAIRQRRTVRGFASRALDVNQVSQLLWAAAGITGGRGFKRAAPSAGALYPMDLFVVAGQSGVQQLDAAVYHYQPQGHHLVAGAEGDLRQAVARAALGQMWMATAPVNVVITAEYHRVTRKYGNRGVRYAMIEAGHIGQNLFLQAEALGLKAGIVGAFDDKKLAERLSLPTAYEPLLVMPVGYTA